MLPIEDIKEIINYVIDQGIEKGMSVSVNFYADNVEVSAYAIDKDKIEQPVTADIAERLGIEPKEG